MIRAARPDDSAALVPLFEELGYPSTADAIRERLLSHSVDPDACVLVAEQGREILGLASLRLLRVMHADEPIAMLTSLVVRSDARGSGVGRRLVAELEAMARARGCVKMILTSGNHRSAAHRFYERVGFSNTGHRFAREIRDEK